MNDNQMESVSHENRIFPPSEAFKKRAHINSMEVYRKEHQRSLDDPEAFWGEVAESLHWYKKWDRVLDDSKAPFYKWFTGGTTNICYNAVDRWADGPSADKRAIIWEGEPGDQRVLTYADLKREVSRFANVLKSLGIRKGDTIALYLPMIPELAIAVLACARIGAVHSGIFAGFSAESTKDRVQDGNSKMVITGDGGWRRGSILPLKSVVDQGVEECDCLEHVLVVPRNQGGERIACEMQEGRDVWYDEAAASVSDECPCEEMDAEDLLFLLYTSGSTGKPKGIMHTVGGYSVYTYLTSKYVFGPQSAIWVRFWTFWDNRTKIGF